MKTLMNLALAMAIGLSVVSATPGVAKADEASMQREAIVTEIMALEREMKMMMYIGDFESAKQLDAMIAELEMILHLMGGDDKGGDISSGTLGSGRISQITNTTLGSGR